MPWPLPAFKTKFWLEQTERSLPKLTDGKGLTWTLIESLEEQPKLLVTVTEYNPDEFAAIEDDVCPFDQIYE